MIVFARRVLRENWREHEAQNGSRKVAFASFMDTRISLVLCIGSG